LDEKIAKLKKNLDADSQELIDKIIKRQEYIFTHNLLDNRLIFNSDELREQKLVHSFYNKKNTYFGMCPFPESFYYHNGLKTLPKDVLAKIKGKDVIDGGAFIGDTAIIFCKNYSFGKIYSFEPDRFNYIKLKENIAKYNMENVMPISKGIFSKEEKVKFKIQGVASSVSLGGNEEIEVTQIDKFVESNDSNMDVGLIKFDIEGSEFDGIVGSLSTIKKFRPVLLISIYHTSKDFFEIKPLLESLNLGYKFMIKKINPNNPTREIMLIAYVNNMIS
jgi:FkbM family methyltransferase